nr:phospholipase A [Edwardsiella hoshinae]
MSDAVMNEVKKQRISGRTWMVAGFVLLPLAVQADEKSEATQALQHNEGVIANMLRQYDNPFTLYPYSTNYVLYTQTSDINKQAISSYDWGDQAKKNEIKFQISLAFPIWRGIAGENSVLGAAYTQQSWWQAFNRSESSPFRETNYEPRLFLGWAADYALPGGWSLRDIEVGAVHQSNGRADPTSRSWNRVYTRLLAQNGNFQLQLMPWYRLPESPSKDDNPDITKYMGYYEAEMGYRWGESVFSLRGRYNWNSGYGAAELGWSYPLSRHVRFYTQLFSGYGESLIDYNFRQTRFGVGIMLNDIL